MPAARHAVRDHGGEQRFDGAQQGDGDGGLDQLAGRFPGYPGQVRDSDRGADLAETAPDCLDGEMGQLDDQRRDDQRDERRRDAAVDARPAGDDCEGQPCDPE